MKGPGVLLPAVPALRVRARRLHRLAGAGGLRSDDIYIYVNVCIYIYVCMYVYIYIYIYTHTLIVIITQIINNNDDTYY